MNDVRTLFIKAIEVPSYYSDEYHKKKTMSKIKVSLGSRNIPTFGYMSKPCQDQSLFSFHITFLYQHACKILGKELQLTSPFG